jgi:hypothetical protein
MTRPVGDLPMERSAPTPDTKPYRQAYLEIASRCNLSCSFCPAGRDFQTSGLDAGPVTTTNPSATATSPIATSNSHIRTPSRPAFIPTDDFARLAAQIAPLASQLYLHVLGEPLLHPQLDELLECCARLELPVAITTNGTLLASRNGTLLLHPIVRQVNLSLQDLLDGDGLCEKHLPECADFMHRALEVRPDLYVDLRLWNRGTTADQTTTAHSKSAETIAPTISSNEPINTRSNPKNGGNPSNDEILEWIATTLGIDLPDAHKLRSHRSHLLRDRIHLNLDRRFEWPELPSEPREIDGERSNERELGAEREQGGGYRQKRGEFPAGTCLALKHQFALLTDGTLLPCCLDWSASLNLGNALHEPLEQLLAGPRAHAMREGFREGALREPTCQHCDFARRFSSPPPAAHRKPSPPPHPESLRTGEPS